MFESDAVLDFLLLMSACPGLPSFLCPSDKILVIFDDLFSA